jgi:hypothetical protein
MTFSYPLLPQKGGGYFSEIHSELDLKKLRTLSPKLQWAIESERTFRSRFLAQTQSEREQTYLQAQYNAAERALLAESLKHKEEASAFEQLQIKQTLNDPGFDSESTQEQASLRPSPSNALAVPASPSNILSVAPIATTVEDNTKNLEEVYESGNCYVWNYFKIMCLLSSQK